MASVTTEGGGGPLPQGVASTLLTPKGSPAKPVAAGSTSATPKVGEKVEQAEKPELYWMVQPCFVYKDEYKDCKSFKARFHQYFVDGKSHDCQHWKEDYDNCTLWENKGDTEALKKVIDSESGRVRKRLRDHYSNNVWQPREAPPPDWNKPLPPAIAKDYENSYLKQKADGLRNGTEKLGGFAGSAAREGLGDRHAGDEGGSSCSIM